ncbi:hypothetical protein COCON_G00018980 [Conger conger]|uniref:Uncharacterized protein n=1 Tax=Conger conger TaxID=82655 RepID=A0A9Q1E4J6_CONCO|nr:hypothetical protein COCON_G00018980 [Conger conger]
MKMKIKSFNPREGVQKWLESGSAAVPSPDLRLITLPKALRTEASDLVDRAARVTPRYGDVIPANVVMEAILRALCGLWSWECAWCCSSDQHTCPTSLFCYLRLAPAVCSGPMVVK